MRAEKRPEARGFPLYAFAISLLLHGGLLLGWAPGRVVEPVQAPSAGTLQGRLLPSQQTPLATATVPVPPPQRDRIPSAEPRKPPPAAMPPAGILPPEAPAAAAGPVPGAAAVARAATMPHAEMRERGPDAAGLRQFRLALAGEARHLRHYPEAARQAGLAGTAEVRIAVEAGGAVRHADLARTSGHAQLDAAAVAMLREAAARASLPDSLRGLSFAVLLPVVFEVED